MPLIPPFALCGVIAGSIIAIVGSLSVGLIILGYSGMLLGLWLCLFAPRWLEIWRSKL